MDDPTAIRTQNFYCLFLRLRYYTLTHYTTEFLSGLLLANHRLYHEII